MQKSLNLSQSQTEQLARVLDDIDTERAQARVDERRTHAGFADAFAAASFDATAVRSALDLRQKSEERVRNAVLSTLTKTHAILDPTQRERLATMLRTGDLSI
jgi:uncharacterized membrane protein